jgi:Zn-dependent peptidase ImmA (M78 family)
MRSISDEEIECFAEVLNYPKQFFYQCDPVYGPGVSELYHRKRQEIPIKILKKNYATIHLRNMQVDQLLKSVDLGTINLYQIDIDEPTAPTPEEVARITRASLNIPAGPINNVVALIEDAGGIVIPYDFETNKIDAMSRWIPGSPPLFFINTRMPTDRIRFTLCHELGHIIMHRIPNNIMENQADDFAGEFLMPKHEIKNSLDNLALEKLPALKKYWKVSMAFLIYRAKKLNRITENQARYLYAQMGRFGYRTKEPKWLEPPKEMPRLFYDLVKVHIEELNYSESELCKVLYINKNEFTDIFKSNNRRLSIVK